MIPLSANDHAKVMRTIEGLTPEKIRNWVIERMLTSLRNANAREEGPARDRLLQEAAYLTAVVSLLEIESQERSRPGGSQ